MCATMLKEDFHRMVQVFFPGSPAVGKNGASPQIFPFLGKYPSVMCPVCVTVRTDKERQVMLSSMDEPGIRVTDESNPLETMSGEKQRSHKQ